MNLVALELRSVPIAIEPSNLPPIELKTDAQLIIGWWYVRVGEWEWIYDFNAQGDETKIDFRKMMKIVLGAGYHGFVGIEKPTDRSACTRALRCASSSSTNGGRTVAQAGSSA